MAEDKDDKYDRVMNKLDSVSDLLAKVATAFANAHPQPHKDAQKRPKILYKGLMTVSSLRYSPHCPFSSYKTKGAPMLTSDLSSNQSYPSFQNSWLTSICHKKKILIR
jgi:hypothetical protein